ncbi:MAG: sigma-70 family RNA polymerase sigma factor [Rhodanobacteraceae bacterium]|nr:sigma-70 family RNA polymerase sigma factor [Rhodanobacteraceae bacterium]
MVRLPSKVAGHLERSEVDALFALAYAELRQLARGVRGRSGPATLDTTALVHEAFLRLSRHPGAVGEDPGHLRALAARAMRHILIDHARRRQAGKRGGGADLVSLGPADAELGDRVLDLVDLDRALSDLEALDARLGRVVELHLFAGLEMAEIGRVLGLTERTAFRDWRRARAFLTARLDPR